MPKRSAEEYAESLLGGGFEATIQVPPALYDKLVELARRRYGNLPKPELVTRSLPYAAALGTVSWSSKYGKKRGPKKAKTEEKKS